ncbi:uncharacterized protein LOC144104802 [Amblyomma americanum]
MYWEPGGPAKEESEVRRAPRFVIRRSSASPKKKPGDAAPRAPVGASAPLPAPLFTIPSSPRQVGDEHKLENQKKPKDAKQQRRPRKSSGEVPATRRSKAPSAKKKDTKKQAKKMPASSTKADPGDEEIVVRPAAVGLLDESQPVLIARPSPSILALKEQMKRAAQRANLEDKKAGSSGQPSLLTASDGSAPKKTPAKTPEAHKGSDRTSERTSDKSSDKNASRASPIWSASTSGREWTGSGAPGGGIGGGLRLLLLGDDGDSWACVYAVLAFVTVASVAMIVAAVISPETVRKVFAFLLNMDSAVVVAAAARAADASNGERRDA